MNIGLVTSYIIAGIIMLSIFAMNMSLSNSSTELTINNMKKRHLSAVSETFSSDISKMGYNLNEKVSPIITAADTNKISFRSNIDNSADGSVETLTWELTSNEVTTTENPNDYILNRSVDGDMREIKLGVTKFVIRYYDTYGAAKDDSMSTPVSSADFSDIRQIRIMIELQSANKINLNTDGGYYVRTMWEKRISPPNLETEF